MRTKLSLMIFTFFVQIFNTAAQVKVEKNIFYGGDDNSRTTLSVYHKKDGVKDQDVIVFIHGGSWNSGKKETYWWLGRNFAKKGVVTAVINYPLSPNANYREMAVASAKAVKWVVDNIAGYGGNPKRIFLMGHSAGGHLCELINADGQYFKELGIVNPIKGVILNDAFGLDMDEYLTNAKKDGSYFDFLKTFSTDQKNWQLGSPLHYVKNITNPQLVFYGNKTYPAIQIQSTRIVKLLQDQKIPIILEVIDGKKHVGMITQMLFGGNRLYKSILQFMNDVK